jgi:mannosyltransferase
VLALVFRVEGRGMSFWLDEGLSVGIASHPFTDIPGLLRQDGSPPLYYLVLHVWMLAFGSSEEAVRALSLLFGLATIPLAFWSAGSLFGRRAAWAAATLAATSGSLAYYSREARMYTLVSLLALLALTAFVHAFAFGRRRWLPVLVLSLVGLLYTHNWGLYLALGLAAGTAVVMAAAGPERRRRVLVDGFLVAGATALAYAPWVPTLVAQAATTGAPWSRPPDLGSLVGVIGWVVDHDGIVIAFALVGLPAVVVLARRWRAGGEALAAVALAAVLGVSMVSAWVASLVEPAWASRYFTMFVPAVVLLMALGLAREGRRGLWALGLVAFLGLQPLASFPGIREDGPTQKSNVRRSVLMVDHLAGSGDLVVSTQIEHVPLLRYYLGPELRYADPLGEVDDPQVVDWRNATERLRQATPELGLSPLVEGLGAGRHVFLVCPRSQSRHDDDEDPLEWFALMERHCLTWRDALVGDASLTRVLGPVSPNPRRTGGSSVFITVFEKQVEPAR